MIAERTPTRQAIRLAVVLAVIAGMAGLLAVMLRPICAGHASGCGASRARLGSIEHRCSGRPKLVQPAAPAAADVVRCPGIELMIERADEARSEERYRSLGASDAGWLELIEIDRLINTVNRATVRGAESAACDEVLATWSARRDEVIDRIKQARRSPDPTAAR